MCELKKYHNTSNTQIDKCMRDFIKWLSEKHRIVACCCGHNKYPMSVVVKEGRLDDNAKHYFVYLEIFSQIEIPRKKNFYKRDKQGYYFIPEVENATK